VRVWLDRFGVAVGYLAGCGAAAVALHAQSAGTRARWLDWASTNLANLRHHPVSAMVVSAFLAEGDTLDWMLLAAAGLATIGWVLGAWRTAVLVGAAHVLGTLVSEGILGYRIAVHQVPPAQLHIRDVGPSYIVMCALAAGIAYGPWPGRVPCAIGFALAAPGSFAGLPSLDVAAVGHLCSVIIALALGWPLYRSRRRAGHPAATGIGPVRTPLAPDE
jgi:hypothetical protein